MNAPLSYASTSTKSPHNPWVTHSVVIESITPEIADVSTYHLRFLDGRLQPRYEFGPGQFNMLYLPGYGEAAISISGEASTNGSRTLLHTVRAAGNVTRALQRLGPGGTFGLRGPFGSQWPVETLRGRDVIVAAGGIGLAPLRPLIRAISAQRTHYRRMVLLYGARTPEALLYTREYGDWSAQGWEIHLTVDRASPGWRDNVGVVPLLIDRLRPFHGDMTSMVVCGPDVMMHYAIQSGLARGIPRQHIWLSLERNMHCAVGLCGHCQLGPAFVCKDGPVFRYDQMERYLHVKSL